MVHNAQSSIKRALLSVSDKTGLVEFAQGLTQLGIELISTGGTYQILRDNNIEVEEVSEYTGFPEIMSGRVKTLHPKIHGGILGRRGPDGNDEEIMKEHDIKPIDLVVVNLYPFERTIKREDCDLKLAIENIDIGGPAMLRAAAKNYLSVGVIVNTADYSEILAEIKQNTGVLSYETRFKLAAKAFSHTARYDQAIADYFAPKAWTNDMDTTHADPWPRHHVLKLIKSKSLRYGENPHQRAAFYVEPDAPHDSIAKSEQIQGKILSFNNIADSDAAFECVKNFDQPACVIVKHANPCGVGLANNCLDAYQKAYQTDPTSAFGGIIAFNRPLQADVAKAIISQQFVEVIIAPGVSQEAATVISKKSNIRLLQSGDIAAENPRFDYKKVNGGLLVQDYDQSSVTPGDIEVVTDRQPNESELRDMMFAWKVAKYVKSNAIVYAKDLTTLGIGAGQMSRVYSSKVAVLKATDENLTLAGAVMASDAFFPFADGLDVAKEQGITAVIQPGGSIRDKEVIAAANAANMTMIFTKMRHFKH